jgi:hypothetical protein
MGMDIPMDIWIKREDIHPLDISLGWVSSIQNRDGKEDNDVIIPIFSEVFTLGNY